LLSRFFKGCCFEIELRVLLSDSDNFYTLFYSFVPRNFPCVEDLIAQIFSEFPCIIMKLFLLFIGFIILGDLKIIKGFGVAGGGGGDGLRTR